MESAPVPAIEVSVLDAVCRDFLGRQTQIPPMFSALKRDGQPLYKLARAGVEVDRPAREIEIFQLTVSGIASGEIELETLCSKGTYVRVLAEDIARALGTCGHVIALRRMYVEPFAVEPMETLESIAAVREQGGWPRILAADWPLTHLPKVSLTGAHLSRLMHGQAVPVPSAQAEIGRLDSAARIRLYDGTGRFLGIGESDGHGNVRPRRLFVLASDAP